MGLGVSLWCGRVTLGRQWCLRVGWWGDKACWLNGSMYEKNIGSLQMAWPFFPHKAWEKQDQIIGTVLCHRIRLMSARWLGHRTFTFLHLVVFLAYLWWVLRVVVFLLLRCLIRVKILPTWPSLLNKLSVMKVLFFVDPHYLLLLNNKYLSQIWSNIWNMWGRLIRSLTLRSETFCLFLTETLLVLTMHHGELYCQLNRRKNQKGMRIDRKSVV